MFHVKQKSAKRASCAKRAKCAIKEKERKQALYSVL